MFLQKKCDEFDWYKFLTIKSTGKSDRLKLFGKDMDSTKINISHMESGQNNFFFEQVMRFVH